MKNKLLDVPFEVKDKSGDNLLLGGIHYTYKFDNGYGLSLIQNMMSHGHALGLYETALTNERGGLIYDKELGYDDVKGYLTEEDALKEIYRVAAFPKRGK